METFRRLLCSLALAASAALPGRAESVDRLPLYQPPEKSQNSAYALALGGTALPILAGMLLIRSEADAPGGLLVASGVLFGPSLGQFYAGSLGTGAGGALLRIAGGLLVLWGASEAMDDDGCEEERRCDGNNGVALATAGWAAFGGGILYSFLDTRFAVKRHAALRLAPELRLARDGKPGVGVRAGVEF